jgi:hypothetical protein
MVIQRLDYDYCEDTYTEQIGGVHNLIQGLIQCADMDTVIGYGDRIGQMIMSGPGFTLSVNGFLGIDCTEQGPVTNFRVTNDVIFVTG